MKKYDWQRLKHLQLGRYAEYLIKMELTFYGLDIYTAEVDDKGIDFVVRNNDNQYFDIQVKSIRGLNYIYIPKKNFQPRNNLLAAIVIFIESEPPHFYLIPSLSWVKPNELLADREYKDKKSAPEWGLNISQKNMPLLEKFSLEKVVKDIMYNKD
ncbi:MAG TPA: DUF4365 domain-containing protein [Nitrospirae bacterium]|nr:hypothetical protein BMS3Abin06_02126 [bacterium BMS3Abin06]HDH12781.1 DUF4365 domain-containing protein [Nitrospirota bacterium]HDZ03339.1 DUF4365 domain-containing protein [Nitrospirota bacterium]